MLKKLLLILIVISFSATFAASNPYIISFQGKLDGYQQFLNPDGKVTVLFGIYDNENRTNELWSDYYFVDIDASGMFNVLIGSNPGKPIPSEIFINQSPWLSIHVGGQGGVQLEPPQPITAAPYAFVAKNLYGGTVEAKSIGISPAVKGENVVGGGPGVYGIANTNGGYGVRGQNNSGYGVYGYSQVGGIYGYAGVYGEGSNSIGVKGIGHSGSGPGVYGYNDNLIGDFGVYGKSDNSHGVGGAAFSQNRAGVFGVNNAVNGCGVHGASVNGIGVYGTSEVIAGSFYSGGTGVSAEGGVIGGSFHSRNGIAALANSDDGIAIVATNESQTNPTVKITNKYQDQNAYDFGTALFLEKGKLKASNMGHDSSGNPDWGSPNGAIVGKFSASGNDGVINTAGNASIIVKNKYVKPESTVLLTWKRTGGTYAIPVVYLTSVEDGQFGVHVYADDNESGYQGKTVSVDVYYMVIN